MTTVLGVSGSLRNARYGQGSDKLVEEIEGLADESALMRYLEAQTKIRLQDVIDAGLNAGTPFDEIYQTLRKSRSDRGLSNSEAALVAGLWGARQSGATIRHCGLGTYFPMTGTSRDLDGLRRQVLESDAILVSGPVYFGDRGSLTQEFFEFLHRDPECAAHIRDRLYGGIAVGAKRNGGQETTLIYQLIDALNMNMLGVGNDSETTAQYGGTALAGDVGTLHSDSYGIKTSIGTGQRLAKVGRLLELGRSAAVSDPVRIDVWLLQDTPDHHGRATIESLAQSMMQGNPMVQVRVLDFTEEKIYRCIACDICPTGVGDPTEYRCIIEAESDLFKTHHGNLIDPDAVLIAAYSPIDRREVNSVYQRFTERTRYLRRDDYVYGDRLVAPLVISEVNSNQNLHIRMMTSFIRHHMVLHHPLIGMEHGGVLLNPEALHHQAHSFARLAVSLTAGRLQASEHEASGRSYQPVGYVISKEKQRSDLISGKTEQARRLREDRHRKEQRRLVS